MNQGQHATIPGNRNAPGHSGLHLAYGGEPETPYRRVRLLTGQIDWKLIGAVLIALTVLVEGWHIILGAVAP